MRDKGRIIQLMHLISRYRWPILLLILLAGTIAFFYHFAIVKLSIATDTDGEFKIYFPDGEGRYTEENMACVIITPQQTEYFFIAPRIRRYRLIRIDPINQAAQLEIYHLSFYQFPFGKIDIVSDRRFDADLTGRMRFNDQVGILSIQPNYIAIKTSDFDGQLQVSVNPYQATEITFVFLYFLTFLVLALFSLRQIARYNMESYGVVPLFMGLALGLVLVMAIVSQPGVHPDEPIHINAAKYYSEYWLPPEICRPNMEWSYSLYGISRLNSLEVFYFFAGKYYALAKFIPGQVLFQFRSLNVVLFALLTLMTCLKPAFRLYCVPLLLSPQIWYIFSYFNSDAFALFICYLLIYQLFISDSLLNRYLQKKEMRPLAGSGAIIIGGFLVGMLPFIKKNYYAFAVFLACFGILALFRYRTRISKKALIRWGAILGAAFFIILGRYELDGYVNGPDRSHKVAQCRETLAAYKFKSSTPAADQWYGLYMREKGITLKEVFKRYDWGLISFKSTFGVYGTMTIYPSRWIVSTFRAILLSFAGFILYCGWKGDWYTWGHIANFGLWSAFLIFASLWNSWNVDLQSQGRYFFPIIAMGAMLLGVIKSDIPKYPFNMLTTLTFCLGVLSFISIGLARIPKI